MKSADWAASGGSGGGGDGGEGLFLFRGCVAFIPLRAASAGQRKRAEQAPSPASHQAFVFGNGDRKNVQKQKRSRRERWNRGGGGQHC